jgi:hypothetical protein
MLTSRLIVHTWFFWSWFGLAEVRLRNSIAALVRGEADAEADQQALNARVRRVGHRVVADLSMSMDGSCCIIFSGDDSDAIEALLETAPHRPGWRFERDPEPADEERTRAHRPIEASVYAC